MVRTAMFPTGPLNHVVVVIRVIARVGSHYAQEFVGIRAHTPTVDERRESRHEHELGLLFMCKVHEKGLVDPRRKVNVSMAHAYAAIRQNQERRTNLIWFPPSHYSELGASLV